MLGIIEHSSAASRLGLFFSLSFFFFLDAGNHIQTGANRPGTLFVVRALLHAYLLFTCPHVTLSRGTLLANFCSIQPGMPGCAVDKPGRLDAARKLHLPVLLAHFLYTLHELLNRVCLGLCGSRVGSWVSTPTT